MAVSGTFNFNLEVEGIIEKAMEWAGVDNNSGEALKQARTSLSLLLLDMENRGHPLAKLKNKTLDLTSSVAAYTLSAGTLDILSAVVTTSASVTTPLKRIPIETYHKISDKNTYSLPSQYVVDKVSTSTIRITTYPVIAESSAVFDYWCWVQIQDPGNYNNNLDISTQYLPAITMGLAYFLHLTKKNIGESEVVKRQELKNNYLDMLGTVLLEDRERTSYKVTPPNYYK